MPLFNIVVGVALLLFGRRLFWVFVAGVGFVVAALLTTQLLAGLSGVATLLIAVGIGVIGALVSLFLQRVVVAIAGFLAGGYLFFTVALGVRYESFAWVAFILGGIVGGVLVLALFDWALILLSALVGATAVIQNLALDAAWSTFTFVLLVVLGIAVQARQLAGIKRPAKET